MKLTILLFIITAGLLFYTYWQAPAPYLEGQKTEQINATVSPTVEEAARQDSMQPFWEENTRQKMLGVQQDSLYLDFALQNAFQVAQPHLQEENFVTSYELETLDSLEEFYMELSIGQLLGNGQQYLLVRRFYAGTDDVHLSLYQVKGEASIEVLTHVQQDMTYMRDTFFDVNGDQHLDFVINWYPSAGSWSRDVYTLYLNKAEEEGFSEAFTFMNPSFAPQEGLVRGVEYGDPADSGFYKYQWNGLKIDTLEYIYPHPEQAGKYLKTKQNEHAVNKTKGVLLDSLPVEYSGI